MLCYSPQLAWLGRVAEQMGDLEHALSAYENALRHNPMSLSGLTQVAGIARIKENYPKVSLRFFGSLSNQTLATV
jgi:cytochrome c-type biogenesis protein CcmH/NrfG